MEDIVDSLKWRYSTKIFDENREISKDNINKIIEGLRLTPSSYGLQPWHFVIVKNKEIQTNLLSKSWNQPQVKDCSHLIVLCRKMNFSAKNISEYVESVAKIRNLDIFDLTKFQEMMIKDFSKRTAEEKISWMNEQVYIALGNLLTILSVLKIDGCPIEGFDPRAYDQILSLENMGLNSVVICPIGYRSDEDKNAKLAKVRFSTEEVTSFIE